MTLLMAVQCSTIFGLVPAAAVGLPLPPDAAAALQLTFMPFTILVARHSWTLWVGLGTLMLAGLEPVLRGRYHGVEALVANELIALATYALFIVVVFGAVFGPSRFTRHRVRGAIVLYFNIGILFALLHRVMAELSPGAYLNLPDFHDEAAFRAALDHFSYTTQISVGYGGIAPVQPFAQRLFTLEAVIGQVFPATLLAGAVTLAMVVQDDGNRRGCLSTDERCERSAPNRQGRGCHGTLVHGRIVGGVNGSGSAA